ncbi:hypothetical protein GTW66_29185 [Streptomyces sp. SID5473]|uniref:Uncharacterized protein n=1 Tax=Streptomyces tsukubensis (strain DSM 42081 / NBRC 108919 / NRRL 18488 / 9993) TaxID=1114943 RepID=I2MUB9_STRT9|nr:hypothetical protein [Streptomyces tsukubensis]EIF88366.1 hypothetical protein [Streptomyces tsukubensis NRRL18488]MYS67925.1 hypothetical protein [Streptomyces sp. SID5473]QKM70945.1 hypothetical protein STSU_031215 [Streptomyces tsukubensis NRRL18488]TAI41796.1 hypothetical protein EWI31_26115 [Streptomyces tsukubensis]
MSSAAPVSPRLLVADHVAGGLRVFDPSDGRETASLPGRHPAEHAGFLALPGGRTAFVDDRAGELVVLDPYGPDRDGPLVTATAPVAVPAEHLAADPAGLRIAVTTGLGRNEEPWSDLLTAVDLGADGGPRAVRVRTRTGEPGVVLVPPPDGAVPGDTWVVLRHREPGALAVFPWAALESAPPSCPPVAPRYGLPLPDDGHGDAYDPVSGLLFAATGEGVHRARRAGDALVPEAPLPWGGEGRGYYLRLDPVRRTLWSTVRGGPGDPGRWPEWTNCAWWYGPDSGRSGRTPLGPGLVFRFAVAARYLAFARIHPDGDELIVLRPDTGRITARVPLPPMSGAPRPGSAPWDGVQRRAVAASPGHDLIAVSRGGHGEVHLIDAAAGAVVRTLTVPGALDEGGLLALTAPGDGAEGDPVGR